MIADRAQAWREGKTVAAANHYRRTNRACLKVGPEGMKFQHDLNQTGKQVGIKNAASAWTLFWDILMASGWTPAPFPSSHRVRVHFGNGAKHSTDGPALNPAFTDWMMGWPMGWTDPLQPVTGWCQWLRHARLMS